MDANKQSQIVLDVKGMTCGGCARAVEAAAKGVRGVTSARVNLEAGQARVEGAGVDESELLGALSEAGFEASRIA